jgi:hypothetical protein
MTVAQLKDELANLPAEARVDQIEFPDTAETARSRASTGGDDGPVCTNPAYEGSLADTDFWSNRGGA